MRSHGWLALLTLFTFGSAQAASREVALDLVSAQGAPQAIGTVKIEETPYGLLFTPNLKSLPTGVHGFHMHKNPSCAVAMKDGKPSSAEAAGGHFDPSGSGKHLGPYGDGHLGDLPALYVNADGTSTNPVLAPRLKHLSETDGHALMVHAGGDNHADMPMPLGGGAARIACGVI
jgi:Cu-Zn family superoxide dismutase